MRKGGQKRYTVDFLAGGAMAVFRIQWLLPAQLVFDLPTVTASPIPDVEIRVIFVDLVRSTEFPLVQLSFGASLVAVLTIGGVGSDVVAHFARGCVEVGL